MSTDQKISETSPEHSEEKKPSSKSFQALLSEIEKLGSPEEKLRGVIQFMKLAISQSGTPRFKDFWDGRQVAIGIFKEINNPVLRSQMWGEYLELSSEARRLKDILDEHSMFAIEQIDLAIQALEKDIENYALLLEQINEVSFPIIKQALQGKLETFQDIQRELDLLNTLASKINSLRKEVLKTEMRIRFKNKFFERLSHIGDKVFPRRKELIATISQEFSQGIQEFTVSHFNDLSASMTPLFELREDIKSLQELAKILTLNTHSFSESRLQLSHGWDTLKAFEKDRKKQQAQKKAEFKENYDLVMVKISEFATYCLSEAATEAEANRLGEEILSFMRGVTLSRDDVRMLKSEFYNAKAPLVEKVQKQIQEKEKEFHDYQNKLREQSLLLRKDLETLVQEGEDLDYEALTAKRDQFQEQYERLSLSKAERLLIDRLFKQIRDLIIDKKEKVVLLKSEDDQQNYENMQLILKQRKERRVEIKNQLEQYRKTLGTSGLDFEKAMLLRELIDTEKMQLEKLNQSIVEIEEKLSELGE